MTGSLVERLRREAAALLADVGVLARAALAPAAPWTVRVIVFLVVAYVLSPVDLIPDFIPVLGMLDELVLAPLALRVALRLMPPELLQRYRSIPAAALPGTFRIAGALLVAAIWFGLIVAGAAWARS
jgi:uncharacterized membrane protein YkvA (DUF1232 family)